MLHVACCVFACGSCGGCWLLAIRHGLLLVCRWFVFLLPFGLSLACRCLPFAIGLPMACLCLPASLRSPTSIIPRHASTPFAKPPSNICEIFEHFQILQD
jgi:hypothetical protein